MGGANLRENILHRGGFCKKSPPCVKEGGGRRLTGGLSIAIRNAYFEILRSAQNDNFFPCHSEELRDEESNSFL